MRFLRRAPPPQTTALPLCFYGDPVLSRKAATIPTVTDDIRRLAERMIVTMDENDGIGLAAPQVGVSLRLIVLGIPVPDPEEGQGLTFSSPGEAMLLPRMPLALVNPVLSNCSTELHVQEEGCLSIPDLRGPVTRPRYLDLQATLLDGQTIRTRCGGLLARCLQHEVDHLDGKLFVEYLSETDRAGLEPDLTKLYKRTQAELKKQRPRAAV
jgi:peptide deformylase